MLLEIQFCPKDTEQVTRLCQSTERYERQRRNLTHPHETLLRGSASEHTTQHRTTIGLTAVVAKETKTAERVLKLGTAQTKF